MARAGDAEKQGSGPPRRWILAALCVGLLGWDVADAARGVQGRRRAVEIAQESRLASTQPAALETAAMISDDFGVESLFAEWLLGERVREASPSERPGLEAAKNLLLTSLAGRPGSARTRFLLGTVSTGPDPRFWEEPLRLALSASPGLDAAPELLVEKYLSAWPRLSGDQRERTHDVFARALLDPSFVAARFQQVSTALGAEAAVGLLPAEPEALGRALEAAAGDPAATRSLQRRLQDLNAPKGASRPTN
jgi:hypothetical protein